MINIKNIFKMLLLAMFVCAYSNNVWAQLREQTEMNRMKEYLAAKGDYKGLEQFNKVLDETPYVMGEARNITLHKSVKEKMPEVFNAASSFKKSSLKKKEQVEKDIEIKKYIETKGTAEEKAQLELIQKTQRGSSSHAKSTLTSLYENYNPELLKKMEDDKLGFGLAGGDGYCDPECISPSVCKCMQNGGCRCVMESPDQYKKAEEPTDDDGMGGNDQVESIDFCSGNLGIFEDLVKTGQRIFNRLRDLIYVVAGFGIIAVAVGGFFGNLNWKWLGAIVISLVVIATAGELIVLLTGCETFSGALISNTLTSPAPMENIEGEGSQYLMDMYQAEQPSGSAN